MMRLFLKSIILVTFILAGKRELLHAQNFDFSFEHLTTDNGLSDDYITCIIKDQSGFMWFGTGSGLNRYDGRRFEVYRATAGDSIGLLSNSIGAMNIDKDGWIWITTNRGIARFKPETNVFKSLVIPGADLKTDHLTSNVLFIGEYAWFTIDGNLFKVHCATLDITTFKLPGRENYNVIFTDRKDRIWLMLRSAIYRFDEKSGELRYYAGMDHLHPDVPIMYGPGVKSASDTLFVVTYGQGFYYFDEQKDRFIKWKKANMMLGSAYEDFDENGHRFFWCIGGKTGLVVYDPAADQFHNFLNNPRDPFSHNSVQSHNIFIDTANGSTWIATTAGVEKYDPYSLRFRRKYLPPEIDYSTFTFMGEVVKDKTDPSGKTYWMGSWAAGLFKWNRATGNFKLFNQDNGLMSPEVFHVIQSQFGYLVVASVYGLTLFDPRTEKPIRHIRDFLTWPISKKILSVMEASNGDLWFCANYEGLFQYEINTGKVRHWDLPGVVPQKGPYLIASVHEDLQHRFWVGGFNGDVQVITPSTGVVRNISNASRKGMKLPGTVHHLYLNDKKEIWVNGPGNYIAQLDNEGEVKRIYVDPDLNESALGGPMIQDPLGYIWICAQNNVQRLDTRTGERRSFNRQDGLIQNSGINAISITDDGELFLGFQYSLSHINTKRVLFNEKAPELKISEMWVDEERKYVTDLDNLVLHPDDKNIAFEFAALNFSQPQKNNYAFKLEGYDTTWLFSGDKRELTLMNLDGGNYVLKVKASNNDGVWSEEKQIPIRVIPPFVETWTFRILIAAAIGSVIFLVYWYKRQQRKGLEKIRNRIATDLHDDMGSTLSSIRIFSDVAKKQIEPVKPELVPILERIGYNATSLSENMQDIIWTIRSDNDTLEDLVSRMREFGLRVCEAKDIRFETQVSENFKTSKLNIEQRRNLYLIFKETINNAVKYSDCTHIHLFMTQQGNYLKMTIRDDGKGFDLKKVKRGNGLNNLEKRAGEINGHIKIDSQPGKGTLVDLLVKI